MIDPAVYVSLLQGILSRNDLLRRRDGPVPPPLPALPKHCKYCGLLADPKDRRCEGCGAPA